MVHIVLFFLKRERWERDGEEGVEPGRRTIISLDGKMHSDEEEKVTYCDWIITYLYTFLPISLFHAHNLWPFSGGVGRECCVACRILAPPPGIEPMPSAVEALSPNHWTSRNSQIILKAIF